MGCVRRRSYRDKATGKVKRSARLFIRYRDATGRTREEAAFSDHRSSVALLAKRENQAAQGIVNLDDSVARHRKVALASHIEDFDRHMAASGAGELHRRHVGSALRAAFAHIGATHPDQVTTSKIEGYLLDRQAAGRSAKSRNHDRAALNGFFRWGIQDGRWVRNPVASIKATNADADPRRRRRAMSADELRAVVAAARTRPRAAYHATHSDAPEDFLAKLDVQGEERSVIYCIGALVGLRRSELHALVWGDLDLASDPPVVVLRAETTKARRADTLPLAPGAAAALRAWRETWVRVNWRVPGPRDRVFRLVNHGLLEAFWHDCDAAEVARETEAGRLDIHSLRHSTASFLCGAGVPAKTAQELMRHRDCRTTLKTYAHLMPLDRQDAVKRLPDPFAAAGEKVTAKAVGSSLTPAERPLLRPLVMHTTPHNAAQDGTGEGASTVGRDAVSPCAVAQNGNASQHLTQDAARRYVVGLVGVEPTTLPLSGARSGQVSYRPKRNAGWPTSLANGSTVGRVVRIGSAPGSDGKAANRQFSSDKR